MSKPYCIILYPLWETSSTYIGEGNPSSVIFIHNLIISRNIPSLINRRKSDPEKRFHQPCYPKYHFDKVVVLINDVKYWTV